MERRVKKAIITAAGRGTRFLPITKVVPKEMLPIGNKPTLHYLLQECKESGIEEVCIVVREWGSLTEKYFETDAALREHLLENNKLDVLAELDDPALGLKISFVKQDPELPYGNGAPVLSAKSFIDQDDFLFMQGDDLFVGGKQKPLAELLVAWQADENIKAAVSCVAASEEEIAGKLSSHIVGEQHPSGFYYMDDLVEKPEQGNVPTLRAGVGRVLMSADIVDYLSKLVATKEEGRELYIWDAILMMRDKYKLASVELSSKWYTTGNPEQMQTAQKAILALQG